MNRLSTFSLLLLISILCPLHPLKSDEMKVTSLQEVLYTVLKNNLDLKISRLEPILKEQDRIIADAEFSTIFNTSVGVDSSENKSTSNAVDSFQTKVGLQKKLPVGTQFSIQGEQTETENSTSASIENNSSVGISINISQPLLKNFGTKNNLSNVWRAENEVEISKLNYMKSILDLIQIVEKRYWNLALQYARYSLSKSTVAVAESLVNETIERSAAGMSTQLDVLQSKANLSNRKEQILEISNAVKNASDQLRVDMGNLSPILNTEDVIIEKLPEPTKTIPELSNAWSQALATDLERRIQQANLKGLGYDQEKLKNETRTDLSLVANGSSSGNSTDSWSNAFGNSIDRESYNWGIGLELKIPWGNRIAGANFSKINSLIEREYLRLEKLDQNLYQKVRSEWRSLRFGIERLQTNRESRELEEQVFEQAKVQYRNGLVLFRFVQEAQDSLNRAKISELNAWIDVLNSRADLSRLDGSLLKRLDIELNFKDEPNY